MASRNRSAQVMLEYLVMAMIVIGAIIYGGPFLVNSIGAHFKGMENNMDDSVNENIQLASKEICVCSPGVADLLTPWPIDHGCGADGCDIFKRSLSRICLPANCALQSKCVDDSTCCAPPVPGNCGTVSPADAVTLCASRTLDPLVKAKLPTALGPCSGTTCRVDERMYTMACSGGLIRYGCVPDTAPVPVCKCVDTTWTPDPSTKCVGTTFTQTSNCLTEKTGVAGTKPSSPDSWWPLPESGCVGTKVTQNGDCINDEGIPQTQEVDGTRVPECPAPADVLCGVPIESTNVCGPCGTTGTAPNCGGKGCGTDACGNLCGTCAPSTTCNEGYCTDCVLDSDCPKGYDCEGQTQKTCVLRCWPKTITTAVGIIIEGDATAASGCNSVYRNDPKCSDPWPVCANDCDYEVRDYTSTSGLGDSCYEWNWFAIVPYREWFSRGRKQCRAALEDQIVCFGQACSTDPWSLSLNGRWDENGNCVLPPVVYCPSQTIYGCALSRRAVGSSSGTCTDVGECRFYCESGGYWEQGYNACGCVKDGCFVAGTKILMGDGTEKAIEDVVKGDMVQGSDKPNKVDKPLVLAYDGWLYSLNGGGYFVTGSHAFMTQGGTWKAFDPEAARKENPQLVVEELKVGDVLMTREGAVALIRMDRIWKKEAVYNFVVNNTHDYYADGYLVHNAVKYTIEGEDGKLICDGDLRLIYGACWDCSGTTDPDDPDGPVLDEIAPE